MNLLEGMTTERAQALIAELSYEQLCGLLLAKGGLEGLRVEIRTRPREHRVSVRKRASSG